VIAASLIDWEALADVALAALAFGIGTIIVFSVVILAITRFAELRRERRTGPAAAYMALGALALATFAATVALGLIVMATK
jgi:hypothetical protein